MSDVNNRYREEENDQKNEEIKEEKSLEKETEKEEKQEEKKNNDKHEKKLNKKIDALIKENEELKLDLKKAREDVLAAKAEEINFKKRVDADKNLMIEYANQKVFEKLIPQLDMFDKVVSMPTEDPVLKNYLMGFQMINNNLKQVLEEEGVKKIIVKAGDKMDPKFHHALQTESNVEYDDDVVLAELQTGYLYKGRILRPALVKVNKKEGK